MTEKQPYGLMADIHLHDWSSFATTTDSGANSRLMILIEEIWRCAESVKKAGGDTIVIAGDLFHVRGSVKPSVLVPAIDCFMGLIGTDINVIVIPGNHDLEGKDSVRLGNACTALEAIGVRVVQEPTTIDGKVLVPWHEKLSDLRACIERFAAEPGANERDLIIHAPVNGVIKGLPDHGLDPTYLAGLGFRGVFSGHFHNHVSFPGEVYSIGAAAHHTWSDVGTRAGHLVVGAEVTYHPSVAPSFVDISDGTNMSLIKGNYVRVKTELSKTSELATIRSEIEKAGAKGVTIISVKKPAQERAGAIASVAAGASIFQSIGDWVGAQTWDTPERTKQIQERALKLLADIES